jgi:predicted nuclease with TOPRIM domain
MRILFQRYHNQIEDEGKKLEQIKKENDKMRSKIKFVKDKLQKRKRKIDKLFNKKSAKLDDDEKLSEKLSEKLENPKVEKKETFCGFTKGFLL